MWLCRLLTCKFFLFLSKQKKQRPQRLIQSPKKRRHQVSVVVMSTQSHNPYRNLHHPDMFPPLSISSSQRVKCSMNRRTAEFVGSVLPCLYAWVKVCAGVRVCVWKTSPRCQDADPAMTTRSQGSSVITVPSPPHDGVRLQFPARKLYIDRVLQHLVGVFIFRGCRDNLKFLFMIRIEMYNSRSSETSYVSLTWT